MTDRAYRQGRLVMDSKQDLVDEIERLRAVLRRIVTEAESDDGLTAWDGSEIAREALRDEQSPKLTEPDENGRQYEEGMRPSDDAEFGCKP